MMRLRTLAARVAGWLRGSRLDRRLDEEVETHLALLEDEHLRHGLSPADARAAARKSFGRVAQIKEQYREQRGLPWFETTWHDLKFASRSLRRTPLFSAVAIATLALGIGANTAIFQLLDAVRLRTLPVHAPEELAEIRLADSEGARGSFETWHPTLTNPIWEAVRPNRQPFSGLFAWAADSLNLSAAGEARFVRVLWISGEGFQTLGVKPVRGRLFNAADDRRGCAGGPGVVISHAFWQSEYARDPSAVGRTLAIGTKQFEIVGVTPASFFGLEVGRSFDIALPLCAETHVREANSRLDAGTVWWLTVVGRLKPGWTLDRATAYLSSVSPGVFQATLPANYPPVSVKRYLSFKLTAESAASGVSELRESYSLALWMLMGIAGLVLFIACANIANLMLARATAREREVAVRVAIGASRLRVIRQFLTESLTLSLLGAAAGVLLAQVLSKFLVSAMGTEANPLFVGLPVDVRMLGFTAALAVATCVLFGIAPALQATRTPPITVIRSTGRSVTTGRKRFGFRRLLVVSQVAVSLVLVVTALLFSGTLRNLLTVDPGFDTDGLIVARVGFRRLQMPPERVLPFRRELVARLRAIPGVESASEAAVVPLTGSGRGNDVWVDGGPRELRNTTVSLVDSGYFQTIASPLVAGRDFSERDDASSPKVAIVNQRLARDLFGESNPIGRRIWIEQTPSDPETLLEIVGVTRDAKYWDLRESFPPVLYLSRAQEPRLVPSANIILRSNVTAASLTDPIARALAEISPDIGFSVMVLKSEIRASLLRERIMAMLSGFFGALATVLATLGLYGLISYSVTCRQTEIGIRTALGATRNIVIRMVLRETLTLLVVGLVIGSALALLAAQSATTMLFGLKPHDPLTLIVAVSVLAAAAIMAGYVPARRAANVDPTIALRAE
jgi:putative ABC transport system permease protein